jgi:hypothetical protein
MRGETQATHLEKMMCRHPLFHTYELALPPTQIKRSILKKIEVGDIVLLHSKAPRLELQREGRLCAVARMNPCHKSLSVEPVKEKKVKYTTESKKYDILHCLFGTIRSKEIKADTKIDISSIDMAHVTLKTRKRTVAVGHLVRVGGEVAVEIEKVIQ